MISMIDEGLVKQGRLGMWVRSYKLCELHCVVLVALSCMSCVSSSVELHVGV